MAFGDGFRRKEIIVCHGLWLLWWLRLKVHVASFQRPEAATL
ncbi:hypothetical protein BSIN_2325 [Burkholderia singularis]|uniref:Uncharacterized protein n=1 Tax=Burkholderia singularis TaxID=1503053 RepID=A0A238H1J4_9BURK|nr:hypothetical protein BSIN_2325 [Burkholderia singularis]